MFSKKGTYPPVGLYSTWHIIAIFICFISIFVAIYLTRKMSRKTYYKLLKILSIIVTAMEAFKIIWSIVVDHEELASWFPLYFCSLFIYALWFSWFKNEKIRSLGMAFLAYAGVVAGSVFIICPTTSFLSYPIFHFKCIYSLIFHALFVYCGVMAYFVQAVKYDKRSAVQYSLFCSIFMLIAVVLNVSLNANMMFFGNPWGIPIAMLHQLHDFSQILYTLVMALAHISIGWVLLLIIKLIEDGAKRRKLRDEPKDE